MIDLDVRRSGEVTAISSLRVEMVLMEMVIEEEVLSAALVVIRINASLAKAYSHASEPAGIARLIYL